MNNRRPVSAHALSAPQLNLTDSTPKTPHHSLSCHASLFQRAFAIDNSMRKPSRNIGYPDLGKYGR